MLKQKILEDLKRAVDALGRSTTDLVFRELSSRKTGSTDPVLSIPKNYAFGDYTTNMALQLAKEKSVISYQSSDEIANKIVTRVKSQDSSKKYLEKIEVVGGFINFFLKDSELIKTANDLSSLKKSSNPQKVLVEYGHVNPLKEIHIGHLRTFILGESICRILESLGHEVFRANYQGDIGLHIAKAIWGIKKLGLPSTELNLEEKAKFLGQAYAEGNKSYEEDSSSKQEIDQISTALYKKDPGLQEVYQLARAWSLEYFEPIYTLLGVKYDRCFFESEVFERGRQIVLENIGKVFEKNDGAVIFPGEKYGLHTRVFINSAGNPTYEAKDMGLAEAEYDAFSYDNAIHVVASEQEGYFQVIIKAVDLLFPYLKGKKHHLSYGLVDLKEGKMSSRTGNVVTVNDLYHTTLEKVREVMKESRVSVDQSVVAKVALGAIKFSYLKFSPRPNMVFDLEQSVSLDGDSGPYLQYTFARINSVLGKLPVIPSEQSERGNLDLRKIAAPRELGVNYPRNDSEETKSVKLDVSERAILRQLMYFQETVEQAASTFHPNLLASYLMDLARAYNMFYQENRIIGSEKMGFRMKLSLEVSKVLKKGLYLLGIEVPERM